MRWEDDEFDSEDGNDTIPCPYCQEPIHEDSQRCPHCENYISREDAPPARKPPWIVLGLLVCLLIVILWIMNH